MHINLDTFLTRFRYIIKVYLTLNLLVVTY